MQVILHRCGEGGAQDPQRINPDVAMDRITRPLPDGMTYIKTVFKYGGMPNYTGTNGRK